MSPMFFARSAGIVNAPLQKYLTRHLQKVVYLQYGKMQIFLLCTKNKGNKSETTHYSRPVSLTCLPRRLCEKTVRDAIMTHMNKHIIFSNCQYGFRNKRSCIL